MRFRILDGTRPEAPEAGYWQRVVEALPHDVAIGQVREAPEMLGELAAELARRQQEGQDGLPPIYLLIYNLGRFRDLRKEDDFSFGREDDKPATPGKMFAHDSPRRAGLRDPHHCLVRFLRHGQPPAGPAEPPRLRPAGACSR